MLKEKYCVKYNVPETEIETLYDYIYKAVFEDNANIALIERPQEVSTLKIDIDFKYDVESKIERKYNMDTIKGMVQLYNNAINEYLDISEEKYYAYIFERDAPYKSKISGNEYKDGIHIIYPNILSNDDVFVLGIRQNRLTAKKKEGIITEDFNNQNLEHYRNIQRNKLLIDLTQIPEEVKNRIISMYEEVKPAPRSKLLNYFIEKKLKNLIGDIEDF